MKMQKLIFALAVLLAITAACATPPAPTDTLAPPATPTETQIPPQPASPAPGLPSSAEPQPAAPAHYQAGDPIQLDEIHMQNPIEGWAVSGPYVLLTADGGNTWREATPPEILPEGAAAKAYGAFLDTQTAWVIFSIGDQIAPEAAVWHTTDGGGTWTPSAALLHEAFGDRVWAEFAILDAENGWLMVRNAPFPGSKNPLFRTTDAGATWTPLVGDAVTSFVDVTGMAFSDPANGWLTWSWETTGAYAHPEVAVTTDGGATWEIRELPSPPGDEYCGHFQPILLSTSSIRLLVGCYLYASEDGGITWETTLLPGPVSLSESTLIYFDADRALLLVRREIYSSADGGRTWDFVKTFSWDMQFSFVDPQQGWAVAGVSTVYSTVDGGRTWALIKPVIGQ